MIRVHHSPVLRRKWEEKPGMWCRDEVWKYPQKISQKKFTRHSKGDGHADLMKLTTTARAAGTPLRDKDT